MERQDNIVLCRFFGAINQTLVQFFEENLERVVGDLKGQPWAYLSSSTEAMAGTAECEAGLIRSGIDAHTWGCVQAAYVLKSPVAIAQTRRIRDTIGIEQPLEDVLFDTEGAARSYLEQSLLAYQAIAG